MAALHGLCLWGDSKKTEQVRGGAWCGPGLGSFNRNLLPPGLAFKSLLVGSLTLYFKTKQNTHQTNKQTNHKNNPNQELTPNIWAVKNRCSVRRGEMCGCSLVRHSSILKPMPQETGQNETSRRRSSVLQRANGHYEKD